MQFQAISGWSEPETEENWKSPPLSWEKLEESDHENWEIIDILCRIIFMHKAVAHGLEEKRYVYLV